MKTLLVFYSRRGIARRIASDYKSHGNTDVVEIKVKKNYVGPFGYFKSRRDALRKKSIEIDEVKIDFKNYDRIIIVGSVWSNCICLPIMTFLKQNKGKIKNVEYIAITKNPISNFYPIFETMDYTLKAHFKRATAITVKFNRITSIKRY